MTHCTIPCTNLCGLPILWALRRSRRRLAENPGVLRRRLSKLSRALPPLLLPRAVQSLRNQHRRHRPRRRRPTQLRAKVQGAVAAAEVEAAAWAAAARIGGRRCVPTAVLTPALAVVGQFYKIEESLSTTLRKEGKAEEAPKAEAEAHLTLITTKAMLIRTATTQRPRVVGEPPLGGIMAKTRRQIGATDEARAITAPLRVLQNGVAVRAGARARIGRARRPIESEIAAVARGRTVGHLQRAHQRSSPTNRCDPGGEAEVREAEVPALLSSPKIRARHGRQAHRVEEGS